MHLNKSNGCKLFKKLLCCISFSRKIRWCRRLFKRGSLAGCLWSRAFLQRLERCYHCKSPPRKFWAFDWFYWLFSLCSIKLPEPQAVLYLFILTKLTLCSLSWSIARDLWVVPPFDPTSLSQSSEANRQKLWNSIVPFKFCLSRSWLSLPLSRLMPLLTPGFITLWLTSSNDESYRCASAPSLKTSLDCDFRLHGPTHWAWLEINCKCRLCIDSRHVSGVSQACSTTKRCRRPTQQLVRHTTIISMTALFPSIW